MTPMTPLRILIISNLYPPHVMGGAELAAHSLATWLAENGHAVMVLTSAPRAEDAGTVETNGVAVARRFFPNIYQVYQAAETRPVRKALWHARDHFNPQSEVIVREVIEQFRPDIVNTHNLQGIGYNLLCEIGRQNLPCVQTLHDLGFLCINMNMFKDGGTCSRRHLPCAASAVIKRAFFSSIRTLAFWSPSEALLERYGPYLPAHTEASCIHLPLVFPKGAQVAHWAHGGNGAHGARIRLVYVGQMTRQKGVEFILRVLSEVAGGFELLMIGAGELLEALKTQYAGTPWVQFTGHVAPEEIAGFMAGGDALLVPSLWFENSPLVIHQAGQLGLPILASRIGGIPEFVGAGGVLLEPGDAGAWEGCIRELIAAPEKIRALRREAECAAEASNPDLLGGAVLRLFHRTIYAADSAAPAGALPQKSRNRGLTPPANFGQSLRDSGKVRLSPANIEEALRDSGKVRL